MYRFLALVLDAIHYWLTPMDPKILVGKILKVNKPGYPERYLIPLSNRVYVTQKTSEEVLQKKISTIITDEILIINMVEYQSPMAKEFYYIGLTAYGLKEIYWHDLFNRDPFSQYHLREYIDVST